MIAIIEPHWKFIYVPQKLEQHLERCGRVCYKSEDRITDTSANRFVRTICKSGHESVLEHGSISVKIVCSRAASHQIVRHRIGAYSQESQRYCNYRKKGFQVICPPSVGLETGDYVINKNNLLGPALPVLTWYRNSKTLVTCQRQINWLDVRKMEIEEYLQELNENIPPEDARFNLPNACKTELAVTYNCRMWRHVFRERGLNPRAQWEIRGLFSDMYKAFSMYWPAIFGDLGGET